MMAKKSPWADRGWERGEPIPSGNQGFAFAARRIDDPPGEFNYVLKKLKHQDKANRLSCFRWNWNFWVLGLA
jgi:hypothetical protein